MYDSDGDGWGDIKWSWSDMFSGTVVSTGTLATGSSGTAEVCALASYGNCYTLAIISDGQSASLAKEVTWDFVEDEWVPGTDKLVESGSAPGTFSTCPVPPSPSPTSTPNPTVTPAPPHAPCNRDLHFGGEYDCECNYIRNGPGYAWLQVGIYRFQGFDNTTRNLYWKHEKRAGARTKVYYLYFYLDEGTHRWYISDVLGSASFYWKSADSTYLSGSNPLDVANWAHFLEGDQPGVSLSAACYDPQTPTNSSTSAPGAGLPLSNAPTPTRTEVEVFSESDLPHDADISNSYQTYVVKKANIALTGMVAFEAPICGTASAVGILLTADQDLQATISGNNAFGLLRVGQEVEMTVENLVFTLGKAGTGVSNSHVCWQPACFVSLKLTQFDHHAQLLQDYGGAITLEPFASLTIKWCKFFHNWAGNRGGAILADRYSILVISETIFKSNSAGKQGGAVAAHDHASVTIDSSQVEANHAKIGGGFQFSADSKATVQTTVFIDNTASEGGGLHASTRSLVEVLMSSFGMNNATGIGGGVAVSGETKLTVARSRLFNNLASSGGAISVSSYSILSVNITQLESNTAADSGGAGGGIHGDHSMVILDNSTVSKSSAGAYGGGLALSGSSSKGVVLRSLFDRCTADAGGAISVQQAEQLAVEESSFVDTIARAQGGGVFMTGGGFLEVKRSSFRGCMVRHALEEQCLTLKMKNIAEGARGGGLEIFVYDSDLYQEDMEYKCNPEAFLGYSCDRWEFRTNDNLPSVCEYLKTDSIEDSSIDIEAVYGADCSGCMCNSQWDPSAVPYIVHFNVSDLDLVDQQSAVSEHFCLPTSDSSSSTYAFQVPDHRFPEQVSWELEGTLDGYVYVSDGHAHDLRRIDFAAETQTCDTPGGAALYLEKGVQATIHNTAFVNTTAKNSNGGAIILTSEFSKDATQTTAEFTQCDFSDTAADIFGTVALTSVSQIRFMESNIRDPNVTNLIYNFGSDFDCISGCPPGQYGSCVAVDDCWSCDMGVCSDCPNGTSRLEAGAVEQSQCLPCELGTAANTSGSVQCSVCPSGKGSGTTTGSTKCEPCRAGQKSSVGSYTCDDCGVGEGSSEGSSECLSCGAGYYSFGSSACQECFEGTFQTKRGSASCDKCVEPTTSTRGAVNCTLCMPDYYWDAADESCSPCPEGPEGKRGSCSGEIELPSPKRDYWSDRSDPKLAGYIYRCPRNTCKPSSEAATHFNCWEPRFFNESWNEECDPDKLMCQPGASGILCGSCKKGFTFSSSSAKCEDCSKSEQSLGQKIAPVILLFTVVGCSATAAFGYRRYKHRAQSINSHWLAACLWCITDDGKFKVGQVLHLHLSNKQMLREHSPHTKPNISLPTMPPRSSTRRSRSRPPSHGRWILPFQNRLRAS